MYIHTCQPCPHKTRNGSKYMHLLVSGCARVDNINRGMHGWYNYKARVCTYICVCGNKDDIMQTRAPPYNPPYNCMGGGGSGFCLFFLVL